MTPSCSNCHGAPGTDPQGPEQNIYDVPVSDLDPYYLTPSFLKEDLDTYKTCSTQCSARDHWPEALKESRPELQPFPFWVRSNFEKTLRKNRETSLPLRLNIQKGQIRAQLDPKSFSAWIDLPYVPGNEIQFDLGPEAAIKAQLDIENNAFPLALKDILTFESINIDKPYAFGLAPERLSVGNFGGLHFIFKPTQYTNGILNLLSGPMVPAMPVGYDFPPINKHYEEQCYYSEFPNPHCPEDPGLVYKHPQDSKVLDPIAMGMVPQELLDPATGGLPLNFNLEDFFLRLLLAIKNKKAPDPNRKKFIEMGDILTLKNLKPGQTLELKLDDIQDFFWAGILDLGPSSLDLKVTYEGESQFRASLSDFSLNLDPMIFPPSPGEEGTGLQIKSANISPGKSLPTSEGLDIPSGVNLEYDAKTGAMTVQANIYVSLDALIPLLGPIQLEGQFLLETTFLKAVEKTDEGERFFYTHNPKATTLAIKDLTLFDDEFHPLLTEFNLFLSDNPDRKKLDILKNSLSDPEVEFILNGNLKGETPVQFTGKAKIPTHDDQCFYQFKDLTPEGEWHGHVDGSYLFSEFLKSLDVIGEISVSPPDQGTYLGKLDFESNFQTQSLETATQTDHFFRLQMGIEQFLPGAASPVDLLKNGRLDYLWSHGAPEGDRHSFNFLADSLTLPSLQINGISTLVEVQDLKVNEDRVSIKVPTLNIQLNEKGSDEGLIRGPVTLIQDSDKAVTIDWDRITKRLNISDLGLAFGVQQMVLPEKVRPFFIPGTFALGADGRLEADWTMVMKGDPQKWKGSGVVVLRGDQDGDVYPMNRSGQRMGVPIFRKTYWAWSHLTGINDVRGYLLGRGLLSTWVNLAAFSDLAPWELNTVNEYEGIPIESKPYEFRIVMDYDNQPLTMSGFRNKAEDYIVSECQKIPSCREKMEEKEE